MTAPQTVSRRALFAKLGILFNGLVALVLAIPVFRYVLSPLLGSRITTYTGWLTIGPVEEFPAGQTRLASFRNPGSASWDGKTAKSVCWVRHVDAEKFQVFAVNCAHLGCPVRWFPQSGLFMCPCHGGAYYEDGSRAAGPPERGLFEYPYKVEQGILFIKAGELPTPGAPDQGSSAAVTKISGKFPCA